MAEQSTIRHSPFSYRNDRLRQLQRKPSTSSNPFIAGVDASDLWLSPPQGSLDGSEQQQQQQQDGQHRASSLPVHQPDFQLVGGDSVLPSFPYSSPPSPGILTSAPAGGLLASSSSASTSTAALFPSIDSWIHQSFAPGLDIADDSTPAYYEQPLTYSPPSSAGALSSPSSSSASSSSLRLPPPQTEEQLQQQAPPQRRRSSRRKSSLNTMANVNNNPAVITTDSGAFNVNSKSNMKDACSYDLRDHQEPATVQKEYGGNNSGNKDLQGCVESSLSSLYGHALPLLTSKICLFPQPLI